jgi:hypothetical protein
MKRLYQAYNSIEAQLLADRLAQSHMHAKIFGDYTAGAMGELSALNFPEVWVEDEDWLPAQRVLTDFLAPSPSMQAWTCQQCGECIDASFDLCWQCGAQRS